MLKVNNVAIPTPSTFQVDISDIDGNTTRNARGELIRDRIAVKRKLTLEWKHLTPAQLSSLLKAISGTFFTVTYPDPQEGVDLTKTFYVGDRSAPMYSNVGGKEVWVNIKFNFVEK